MHTLITFEVFGKDHLDLEDQARSTLVRFTPGPVQNLSLDVEQVSHFVVGSPIAHSSWRATVRAEIGDPQEAPRP